MPTEGLNKRSRKRKDAPKPEPEPEPEPARNADDQDNISELPDDLLCKILALIPTKSAAQTSVLSKRWEGVWKSVPTFNAGLFNYYSKTFVNKFMNKYFLNRRGSNTAISSFDLYMGYHGAKSRVDNWLDSAVSEHVKEFKLHIVSATISRKKVHIYSFPHTFLCRLRLLKTVELEGLEWPNYDLASVEFPLLKSLSLEKIYGLVDEQLSALISAAPSLEELILKNCVDLENPRIVSSSLKSVKMIPNNYTCVTRSFQIEARNMESLIFDRGYSHQNCGLSLVSCVSIKYLSLSNTSLSDWLLKALVTALPVLRELLLNSCTELKDIEIESESLERLTMNNIGFCLEKKATIVAPKLAFFSYSDESLMSLAFMCPSFLEAKIQIHSERIFARTYSQQWYLNLIDFLSSLDACKELFIYVAIEKALIIPAELRTEHHPPLPTLKHLKVKTANPLFRKRMFRASLDWISPSVEILTIA